MIKNIIFDVDGTLWDSTAIVADAWNQAVDDIHPISYRITGDQLKDEFGKPMEEIEADLLFDIEDEKVRWKVIELCFEYEEDFLRRSDEDITYPGTLETMRRLSADYKLFIVSNCQKGYIETFLDKNLAKEYITDFECYGNTLTPKGETIQLLMERNGLARGESVYVGDTPGDKAASDYAGIDFIHAGYGFKEVPDARYEIESIKDLPGLLKKWSPA